MALLQRGGVWGLDVGGRGRLGTVWPASVLSLILISMRLIITVFFPIISVLGCDESFEPKERMDCQKNSPTTKRAKKAKELNLLITLFSEPTKM